jgi:hypothetical protein
MFVQVIFLELLGFKDNFFVAILLGYLSIVNGPHHAII